MLYTIMIPLFEIEIAILSLPMCFDVIVYGCATAGSQALVYPSTLSIDIKRKHLDVIIASPEVRARV